MIELTNELLVKTLLFVISFFVAFKSSMKLLEDKTSSIIIGLAVSILTVYYLSQSQELFLIGTYGILGVTLLIALPSAIVFFFLYFADVPSAIRKSAWIFYGIALTFILQKNSTFSPETTGTIITFLIIAIVGILFLDKTIKERINIRRNLR